MRVDTPTQAGALSGHDAITRLKRYVSAFRRRWYLIVIPALVGATLGWFTTPNATEVIRNTKRYYRASHVLIVDQSTSGSENQVQVNLSQASYLVTTGEIPEKVASRLDLPVQTVRESMIALPRDSVQAVEIQTVGTDQADLVKMADAAADELLTKLLTDAQAGANAERDRVITELDRLDGQVSALNLQIAANPPNRDQLEAQQRSVVNQYSLAYEQFAQLANRPAPTAGLVSLEGAKIQTITKGEYDRTRETIREGASYVTGVAQDPTSAGAGTVAAPTTGASASSRAIMGGLVGLALGLTVVLLWDRFDSRLRRRDDIEAATGLTVVAEIPPLNRHEQHDLEVVAHTQIRSRAAEAYRVVRGAILFALGVDDPDTPPRDGAIVLMVTSANPAEGKTTTVANLAAVLAEGGLEVLVINCDFRRPRIHKYLQSPTADAPDQVEAIRIGSVVVSGTNLERVRLITGLGEDDPDANPLEVVALQRRIIKATRSRFDVIILDTAPFLTTNDASELLSETDQVLVVVRSGKTRAEAAQRTVEILGRFEAPVLGIVMNDSQEAESAQYYYYGYSNSRRKRSDGPSSNGSSTSGGAVSPSETVSTR